MGKFDLAKILAGQNVPNLGTGQTDEQNVPNLGTDPARDQIEYIDIGLIDDDPKNFYELSDLDKLAENIELLGLQQPLRVRTSPEDPERVIIVSGHRRRAAIQKLVDDGREDLREIPCIRERDAGSAALQELRLIYANSDTRRMTSAEVSRQAERIEALLYQLKEEGVEFPGRMRDHVAAVCGMSATKVANLKVIRENLIPAWRERWERGEVNETQALALARMPEKQQAKKLDGENVSESDTTQTGQKNVSESDTIQVSEKCVGIGHNPGGEEMCRNRTQIKAAENVSESDTLRKLEAWEREQYDQLIGALGHIDLTQDETKCLAWLAGWSKYTTDNFVSIFRKARPAEAEGQLVISGWMPGGTLPTTPGDVVADVDVGEGGYHRLTCYFDGKEFRFGRTGATVGEVPIRWMCLPPVEETP
jgi:hypothetical protein